MIHHIGKRISKKGIYLPCTGLLSFHFINSFSFSPPNGTKQHYVLGGLDITLYNPFPLVKYYHNQSILKIFEMSSLQSQGLSFVLDSLNGYFEHGQIYYCFHLVLGRENDGSKSYIRI